jgi:hypothetical protein
MSTRNRYSSHDLADRITNSRSPNRQHSTIAPVMLTDGPPTRELIPDRGRADRAVWRHPSAAAGAGPAHSCCGATHSRSPGRPSRVRRRVQLLVGLGVDQSPVGIVDGPVRKRPHPQPAHRSVPATNDRARAADPVTRNGHDAAGDSDTPLASRSKPNCDPSSPGVCIPPSPPHHSTCLTLGMAVGSHNPATSSPRRRPTFEEVPCRTTSPDQRKRRPRAPQLQLAEVEQRWLQTRNCCVGGRPRIGVTAIGRTHQRRTHFAW